LPDITYFIFASDLILNFCAL